MLAEGALRPAGNASAEERGRGIQSSSELHKLGVLESRDDCSSPSGPAQLSQFDLPILRNRSRPFPYSCAFLRLPVARSEGDRARIGGRPGQHLTIGLASSLYVDTAVCARRVRLYSATYLRSPLSSDRISIRFQNRITVRRTAV